MGTAKAGHSLLWEMEPRPSCLEEPATPPPGDPLDFDAVYREHFAFVWRTLRRFGVEPPSLDDAVQDVFLVVHRRLRDFAGRSTVRTWLCGIALRVAHDHRRTVRRKGGLEVLSESVADDRGYGPFEGAALAEAARLVDRLLETLDEGARAVFVLTELEQMTSPEVAEALSIPLGTVYSRLRAARIAFERALSEIECEGSKR